MLEVSTPGEKPPRWVIAKSSSAVLSVSQMDSKGQDITQLLNDLTQGKPASQEHLIAAIYGELRRIAGAHLQRERNDHTLQATALVNEAFLRMVQHENCSWESRTHFFAVASTMMRRVLVDYARRRNRAKRGGGEVAAELREEMYLSEQKSTEILDLDEALGRLSLLEPRQTRVVELRFFGGLTIEQSADVLGVSPRTVKNDWNVARAWLHRELKSKVNLAGGGQLTV
jgi:RNA polymerase sigma factor (TIGR02999 family)